MGRVTFPFGPQHPVLPEAIQLQLTCEDERVVEVLPVIGYMHRGIEKAAEKTPFVNNVFLCERICGICSFIHALCYCELMENLMKTKAPPRAQHLRVFWSELSRIHSHLLWLGLLADSFGFESLFMQCWRAREIILDTMEMTTGQRVIQSSCIIGGVRRDINGEMTGQVRRMLNKFKKEYDAIYGVFAKDYTVKQRTAGKGILGKEDAWKLGALGPTLRASGWASDARMLNYCAYGELGFEPVVENGCDSFARMMVRAREIHQSLDLAFKALDNLPATELAVRINGFPRGEGMIRVEQPRGELFEYVKGNGTVYLERLKVRTPTFANIPTLLAMLPGCELADVPVIVMSIDPCIACTER
ncbi:ech hydrogenase subunit E [Desulfotomaculum arcticum]|uniref:Ech hydrogenase subunit E n=1 Tax=Desulfotruncus arcticus DSM 17038 TaxID=1121424 RepID=A0A1I2YR13_9FIRM|nr:nickel-dependent hydrogenase large subunit [Desulfotruncus arcticus]SFH27998.1 ech hydrogenase subunit E [Desulfotomaculum arcticum] [Desulfotruncus arcticus DSM 17038]